MIVFIQLTIAGTDAGPFDLYSDSDGYVTPFATAVPKLTLTAGTNFTIPDDALNIKAVSVGVCTNNIIIPIGTTTSTTTTTTTGGPTTTSTSTSTSSSTTTSTTTVIVIPCFTYTLSTTAPSFTFDYNYIDCGGTFIASSLSGEGNTTDICAQQDTVAISSGDGMAVVGITCGSYSPTTSTSTTTTSTTTIAPPCYSFTLTVLSGDSALFDVTDCLGNISTLNVNLGDPFTDCFRNASVNTGDGSVTNNGLC